MYYLLLVPCLLVNVSETLDLIGRLSMFWKPYPCRVQLLQGSSNLYFTRNACKSSFVVQMQHEGYFRSLLIHVLTVEMSGLQKNRFIDCFSTSKIYQNLHCFYKGSCGGELFRPLANCFLLFSSDLFPPILADIQRPN